MFSLHPVLLQSAFPVNVLTVFQVSGLSLVPPLTSVILESVMTLTSQLLFSITYKDKASFGSVNSSSTLLIIRTTF